MTLRVGADVFTIPPILSSREVCELYDSGIVITIFLIVNTIVLRII